MAIAPKPDMRPGNPNFSSGPCAKPPGWAPEKLPQGALGRSHRSKLGKSRLKHAIDLTRKILRVPDTHLIGIVPASDTGAVEEDIWELGSQRRRERVSISMFAESLKKKR